MSGRPGSLQVVLDDVVISHDVHTLQFRDMDVAAGAPDPGVVVVGTPSYTIDLSQELPSGAIFTRASSAYARTTPGGSLLNHANNIPRFALDGVRAYLVEPGWVNLQPDPEDFSAWTHEQIAGDVSVDVNVAPAPNGLVSADRLNFLNPASSDVGLSQVAAVPNGAQYMTAIFIRRDVDPTDYHLESAAGTPGASEGVVVDAWQRVSRIDLSAGGVTGLYIRRVTGLQGSVLLWGGVIYANDFGNLYEYHPGVKAPDALALPSTLDPSNGTAGIEWIPKFGAALGGQADSVVLDVSGVNFSLRWIASDAPLAYLALYNNGVAIAKLYTYHSAGDRLRVKIHYGGTARSHLVVNGWAIKATAAWVVPSGQQYVHVACNAAGALQPWCQVRSVDMEPKRHPYTRVVGMLGDSTSDNGLSGTWGRRIGLRIEANSYALCAGVGGQTLVQIAARVQADIIDQGVTDCVVLAGINDVVTDRTLLEMQTDALSIYTALATAGIRVIACTILPFKGAASYNAGRAAIRNDFNAWLLAGSATHVQEVVDTATVVADPADPDAYLPIYDSGDHVHYNSGLGARVLGNALVDQALPDLIGYAT